jgi:diguanylate cyclase (GGDEF)-like protein
MSDKIKPIAIFVFSLVLAAVFKSFDVALQVNSVPHFTLLPLCLISVAMMSWYASRNWALVGATAIAVGWMVTGTTPATGPAQMIQGMYNLVFATVFILLSIFVVNLVQGLRRAQDAAWKDDVTDVLSAKHFFSTVKTEIARAQRYQRSFTIAFIVINNFGDMRKRAGSDISNAMLKRIGEILQRSLRTVDIVGHVADDEFSCFLPETGMEGAHTALPRVHQALLDGLPNSDPSPFSVCVIACTKAGQSVEELTATARAEIASLRAQGKKEILFREA